MMALLLDAATVGLAVAFLLSILCALLPRVGGSPKERAGELLTRLLIPPVGATVAIWLGFWPTLKAALGGDADHCLSVTGPRLCWIHHFSGVSEPHDLAIAAILVGLVGQTAWLERAAGSLRGSLALLDGLAINDRALEVRERLFTLGIGFTGDVSVIAFRAPLCFVTGVLRPRLVLSTGILDRLDAIDVGAILAHEIGHVERRDPMWRRLGHGAMSFHLPGLGRRAFEQWALAAEFACDSTAANHLGSSGQVAGALIRFKRLASGIGQADLDSPKVIEMAPEFSPMADLEARVRELLDPQRPTRFGWMRVWPVVLCFGGFWQVQSVHVFLETLLGFLHLSRAR